MSTGDEEPSRDLGILRSGEETRGREMIPQDRQGLQVTLTGNEGRFHVPGDLKIPRTEELQRDEPENDPESASVPDVSLLLKEGQGRTKGGLLSSSSSLSLTHGSQLK